MSIYREYDIRGIVGKELTEESVSKIGYVFGQVTKVKHIAVGYDARTHSPEIFEYLVKGLNASGVKVMSMGLVPTPVNYFANFQVFDGVSPDASIMITGSHNPSEYNGFKITLDKEPFFGQQIYDLGKEVEALESITCVERNVMEIDVVSRYIDYMVKEFKDLSALKQKIVYDCGNGVAGVVLPEIFKQLSLDAKGIYVEPDGTFPNHHPDPSVEKNLHDIKELLKKEGDVAFAYDGDADRIAVLTHKYNIKGDQMALLYEKTMENPTIIGEVKCSQLMYDELKRRGATAVMYKTGHSNLKVKIKQLNADLAVEVSGHIFFKDRYFGFDDAIYATLRMLELMNNGIDIDAELDKLPEVYATEEIKVKTTEKEKFLIIDELKEMLKQPPKDFPTIKEVIEVDGVRVVFDNGWGLVRASNTTPILVTRFESPSQEDAKLYESALNGMIAHAKEVINE